MRIDVLRRRLALALAGAAAGGCAGRDAGRIAAALARGEGSEQRTQSARPESGGAADPMALADAAASALPWRGDRDPFALGIASGYPRADGAVIWTRLAPEPLVAGGGLDPQPFAVHWELAEDASFRRIVDHGVTLAHPDWAHAVRVELQGLRPQREYHYRFASGDAASPAGRFRTAPAAGGGERLRFAFGSCQQFEQGWYAAYRHMLDDDLDLMVFLGDYIYESSWGRRHVRSHGAGEPWTLDEYRRRHARYRSDPDLQAAHAAMAWILTWDDHEVDNDYAGLLSQHADPLEAFRARRAAAYRAYFEHMPLPWSMAPRGEHMKLYTHVDFGRLARFMLLDDRQYRSPQACPRLGRGGANVVGPECVERLDPLRTMLGADQEQWLRGAMASSGARWNVVAQQTVIAQMARGSDIGGPRFWTDGWDGYPAARARLLQSVRDTRLANPVAIGGDVHCFYANELHEDFGRTAGEPLMAEFVATSISSQGWPQGRVDELVREHPHVRYGDSRRRGYVRVDLQARAMRVELRGLVDEKDPATRCETVRGFEVRAGSSRIES